MTIPALESLSGRGRLLRARVPAELLHLPLPETCTLDEEGSALVDLEIDNGRICRVEASVGPDPAAIGIDLEGRHVWPKLVDMHTHLDKSHVFERALNSDGTITEARRVMALDRSRHWRRDDLLRRMDFSLRCAAAHGVGAIRSHLDSSAEQAETSWDVFRELRGEWAGRIDLQAVSLVPLHFYSMDQGAGLADLVAASGGFLGGVTHGPDTRTTDGRAALSAQLHRLLTLAEERELDIDLHVDETSDFSAESLSHIARAVLERGFKGRVVCGHCCSLALADEDLAAATMKLMAEAGIAVVTLPLANMHLQDRHATRTPRWRGVPPVKELRALGIDVAVAGDNVRDGWFSYGDGDMIDTLRQSIRILHLDHPLARSIAMAAAIPARMIGLDDFGTIRCGSPANLIVFDATRVNHILSRPQIPKVILTSGRYDVLQLPHYEDLR